jgi:predicted outer membrane repeat protein
MNRTRKPVGFVQAAAERVALIGMVWAALAAPAASAANWYVKHDATGSSNGTNWTNAFTSLQTAMSVAGANDMIYVARGTYKPHSTNRSVSFVLNQHNLKLRGGYEGVHPGNPPETSLPGRRAPGDPVFQAILSGEINSGSGIDNSWHVVKVIGPFPQGDPGDDQFVELNGFVITGGYADGNTEDDLRGGGILVVHEVQGEDDEGSTAIRLVNCIVRNNSAWEGGGIYIRNGGDKNNQVQIVSSTFELNAAASIAGPIGPPESVGGGLAITGETPGGVETAKGSVIIVNSLFIQNSAEHRGGAIWAGNGSTVKVQNTTMASCLAGGGASTDGLGGGLFVEDEAVYSLVVNSIAYFNLAVNAEPKDMQISGNTSVDYSDVQDGWSQGGTGNVDLDPGFAAGTYHLGYESPVRDIGLDNDVNAPTLPEDTLDVDDDGAMAELAPTGARQPRLRGASGGTITVDLGWSEVQGQCDGDCEHFDGAINVGDSLRLLSEWGKGGACDIDRDGEVDVADLNSLLAAWGNCPGGESAPAGGGDHELLEIIVAFVESVGGASDSTVPLIIEFLQHL